MSAHDSSGPKPYRHSPPPSRQPPVDNAHVAEGCEQFSDITKDSEADFRKLLQKDLNNSLAARGCNQQTQAAAERVKQDGGFLRATEFDIEAEIDETFYFTAEEAVRGHNFIHDYVMVPPFSRRLCCLTFCVLVLRNGFVVTGESSCVSSENFDATKGQDIARKNAIEKVWPLLGFRLRDQMMNTPA